MALRMNLDEFEAIVEESMTLIPAELAALIDNVAIVVEDWPSSAQDLHTTHGMLLGLYQGVSLTHRSPMSYNAVMPDRITIFRGPHLRITNTLEELRVRVARTVIHEVGHHFGISEERLHELGWG